MNFFTFEPAAWELELQAVQSGGSFSAVRLLALLEGEDEQSLEEAFQALEEKCVTLDIGDIPKPALTSETAVRLRREEQLARSGDFLRDLEETDPLRLYLEEVSRIPAFGDVTLLAQQLSEGDEDAQIKLVNLSLSRVLELACQNTGRGVLLLDLIQEGSMGLWQSILSYRDGDFESYRDWWICQSMAKLITLQARADGVGQRMRRALEDYRAVDERLLGELGRNATVEEIALQLHMSTEEAVLISDMLENARNMNKAKAQPEQADEKTEDDQPVEDTAYFQLRQRIGELLSSLDGQEARLLTLRFGLEGGLPMSPEDTARALGMTPEEVVAKEAAALAKLRDR